ncbi:MAG: HD domain-containing protein [Simkaniaceae bacterium]|nr:HD domain-containing protein [Simkaniaceae bacterium]
MKTRFIFLVLIPYVLFGATIDTFYGPLEVEEPVLLELIDSAPFCRLKSVHQYGVSYYTTHREEYNRHAHSLGVFALLRLHQASLEEQIAGLLHDVSHTVFSHVGDWLFAKANQDKDYQNSIHADFLEKYGLGDILKKHGFSIAEVLPEEDLFPMLEQKGPDLCADRIDYNIQGAYYQGFLTYEEAMQIAEDLSFVEGKWISTLPGLMKKLVRFSLFMTEDCWGSPANYLMSSYLAEAMLSGVEEGVISHEDIHFGIDDDIWNRLLASQDPLISKNMTKILQVNEYYKLVDPISADIVVKSKFRGIDPWIVVGGQLVRLTALDALLKQEYNLLQKKLSNGWGINLFEDRY